MPYVAENLEKFAEAFAFYSRPSHQKTLWKLSKLNQAATRNGVGRVKAV